MLAAMAVTALCGIAEAQSTAPPKPQDWNGLYTRARAADLGSYQPLNPDVHPVIVAHLQPWAKAKMEATNGVADDNGAVCLPTGLFRYPAFAAGTFLWLGSAEKITLVFGIINTGGVQRIYLNRGHPKNLLPTWNGDSVGHWEGDTLVVDSIGFNDKSWLQTGMEPHSEEAHMIQRIRRIETPPLIEIKWTVEDRQALTSAYTYSRYFKRIGDAMPENICDPDPGIWKDFRKKALTTELERSRQVK